jgi:tetratricopeptide (TPR) repeat protein
VSDSFLPIQDTPDAARPAATRLSPEQIEEHNRSHKRAFQLTQGEIMLQGRASASRPSWWTRRKLKRALKLVGRVLEINPENWSAMWLAGKIHQRLGDWVAALDSFARAYRINPEHADVSREASVSAMNAGRHEEAILYAESALRARPSDAGLHANLVLAYLLVDRLGDARPPIEKAIALDPSDGISRTIQKMIEHFDTTGRTPPSTIEMLEKYWARQVRASR